MTRPESAGYDYDVVISGASLAGSAAAILLARRGVRVALLERRSDPEAYKVLCTHSITANAYPVLDELDGGGPGFTSVSLTTADSKRQLVLAVNVYDLGADLKGEPPLPRSTGLMKAQTAALCD